MHINHIGYVQDKNVIKDENYQIIRLVQKLVPKNKLGFKFKDIHIYLYTCKILHEIFNGSNIQFSNRRNVARMSVLAVHEQLQLALGDFLQAAGVVLVHGTPEQVWQTHSCLCEVLSSGSGAYLYTFFLGWNVFYLNLRYIFIC